MGKLIVIDGLDGCGKQTQVEIIYNLLKDYGYKVKKVSFPNYESKAGEIISQYLHGEFIIDGKETNGYLNSLFYTIDRALTFHKEYQRYYDEGYIILADRYISANIIFQGSRFNTIEDKESYFRWMYELETEKLGLPVEDIVLALELPIETSQKLLTQRYNGDESKKDLHESDIALLNRSKETLELACKYLPTMGYNWYELDCSDKFGNILSKDQITSMILEKIIPVIKR